MEIVLQSVVNQFLVLVVQLRRQFCFAPTRPHEVRALLFLVLLASSSLCLQKTFIPIFSPPCSSLHNRPHDLVIIAETDGVFELTCVLIRLISAIFSVQIFVELYQHKFVCVVQEFGLLDRSKVQVDAVDTRHPNIKVLQELYYVVLVSLHFLLKQQENYFVEHLDCTV